MKNRPNAFMLRPFVQRAFTLSELLIVLAILGLIATFTIPKVLQSSQQTQYASLIKTTVYNLESAFKAAADAGTLNQTRTLYQVLSADLTSAKLCATALSGCWGAASLGTGYAQSGIVTASGVAIAGLPSTTVAGPTEDIALDVNSTDGPNTTGKDQIRLEVCVSSSGCTSSTGYSANYGDVMPLSSDANYYNTVMGL